MSIHRQNNIFEATFGTISPEYYPPSSFSLRTRTSTSTTLITATTTALKMCGTSLNFLLHSPLLWLLSLLSLLLYLVDIPVREIYPIPGGNVSGRSLERFIFLIYSPLKLSRSQLSSFPLAQSDCKYSACVCT